MKNKIIVLHEDSIQPVATVHDIGWKKVLTTHDFCESKLTQAAVGFLTVGEHVDLHKHPTMEEFYYFTKGSANFMIEDQMYHCISGTFIKVPANLSHSLSAKTDIQFIYWGIAI